MKNMIVTVAALVVLACGCASLVTNRGIEIGPIAINTNDGLDIFRSAADQTGLVVQGPDYVTTQRYYYEAWPPIALPPTNQVNNPLHLLMEVDGTGEVRFCAVIHGTAKDFPAAQAAAALFEQELDKRNIKYKVWQATAYPPP